MPQATTSAYNPIRDLITVAIITLLLAFGYVQSLRASEAHALATEANGERDTLQAQLEELQAAYDGLNAEFERLAITPDASTAVTDVSTLSRAPQATPPLSHVSVHDMHAALEAGALVIDVREPFEYAEGHVEGTTLVPLASVSARAGEFDKGAPVYVFCRSGNRSLAAAHNLVEAGFSDVRNVEGGIIAWLDAGLPVAP